jgi:hypothetical protein
MESLDLRSSNQYVLLSVTSVVSVLSVCESPVKLQLKILEIFFLWELYVIYMERRERFCACSKCYINLF